MAKRARLTATKNMRTPKSKAGERPRPQSDLSDHKMTTVYLPPKMVTLLRIVAARRAEGVGGRPSVSEVVRGILESHRSEIEKEAHQ